MRIISLAADYLAWILIRTMLLLPLAFASARILSRLPFPLGDLLLLFAWLIIALLGTAYGLHTTQVFARTTLHKASYPFAWIILFYVLDLFLNRYYPSLGTPTKEYLSLILPTLVVFGVFPWIPFPLFSRGRKDDEATMRPVSS